MAKLRLSADQVKEVINNGFHQIPSKQRDKWLKLNYGIGYKTFYNYVKHYNIIINKNFTAL